jgi:hypothetical protein
MHKKILAKEKNTRKTRKKQGKKHAHSHTVGAGAHEHKEELRRWWRGRG